MGDLNQTPVRHKVIRSQVAPPSQISSFIFFLIESIFLLFICLTLSSLGIRSNVFVQSKWKWFDWRFCPSSSAYFSASPSLSLFPTKLTTIFGTTKVRKWAHLFHNLDGRVDWNSLKNGSWFDNVDYLAWVRWES